MMSLGTFSRGRTESESFMDCIARASFTHAHTGAGQMSVTSVPKSPS